MVYRLHILLNVVILIISFDLYGGWIWCSCSYISDANISSYLFILFSFSPSRNG